MKKIIAFFLVLIASNAYSQLSEVRFREQTFANGMTYPQVIISASKKCEDSINNDILRRIADLKASDFCIGQYGYVQKSTHLQIHIFCNCIDFEESQNRFFLYNLDEGMAVPYSDLINPKKKEDAGKFISHKVKTFLGSKAVELTDELIQKIESENLDAFKVEMTKDGVKLWMPELETWGETPFEITWIELKPFLKYHFI